AASTPTGTCNARMNRNMASLMEFQNPRFARVSIALNRAVLSSNNRGFPRADERTDELALCSLCNLLEVGIAGEDRLRVSRRVDPGRLDFNVFKTSATQL